MKQLLSLAKNKDWKMEDTGLALWKCYKYCLIAPLKLTN